MKRHLIASAAVLALLATPALGDDHRKGGGAHDNGGGHQGHGGGTPATPAAGAFGGAGHGHGHGNNTGLAPIVKPIAGATGGGHGDRHGHGNNTGLAPIVKPIVGATGGGHGDRHGHDNNGGHNNTGGLNTILGGGHGHNNGGTHGGHNSAWNALRRVFNSGRRYHHGSYQKPHGWYAHRWNYGEILPALFFSRNYWIDDYSDFSLADPPEGTVWVRYGNDALLIDQDSGEVIQVAYGVFY